MNESQRSQLRLAAAGGALGSAPQGPWFAAAFLAQPHPALTATRGHGRAHTHSSLRTRTAEFNVNAATRLTIPQASAPLSLHTPRVFWARTWREEGAGARSGHYRSAAALPWGGRHPSTGALLPTRRPQPTPGVPPPLPQIGLSHSISPQHLDRCARAEARLFCPREAA